MTYIQALLALMLLKGAIFMVQVAMRQGNFSPSPRTLYYTDFRSGLPHALRPNNCLMG